jgi:hypothetical protein
MDAKPWIPFYLGHYGAACIFAVGEIAMAAIINSGNIHASPLSRSEP